jgi:hypothetical protein
MVLRKRVGGKIIWGKKKEVSHLVAVNCPSQLNIGLKTE